MRNTAPSFVTKNAISFPKSHLNLCNGPGRHPAGADLFRHAGGDESGVEGGVAGGGVGIRELQPM